MLGGIRGLGQIHQCGTERRRLPDEQPVGRERSDRRGGPPRLVQRRANNRALGQTLADEVARLRLDQVSLQRSGAVLHARSGNVNVNPVMIVVKAGAAGSRADRKSRSQESTTAGGSSQLSSSPLARCPCDELHFLHVAKSARGTRTRTSGVLRAHQLCVNAGRTATPFQPYPSPTPVRRSGRRLQPQEVCPNTPSLAHVVRRTSSIPALEAAGQRDGSASTTRAARRCRAGAGASSGPRLTTAAADRLRQSGRLCL